MVISFQGTEERSDPLYHKTKFRDDIEAALLANRKVYLDLSYCLKPNTTERSSRWKILT